MVRHIFGNVNKYIILRIYGLLSRKKDFRKDVMTYDAILPLADNSRKYGRPSNRHSTLIG